MESGKRWETKNLSRRVRGGVRVALLASRDSRYAISQRRRRSLQGLFENGADNKGRGPRPVRRRLVRVVSVSQVDHPDPSN